MFSVSGPVLVTGGAGYIGSHVCKALAEAGAQPICLDTLEKGHDWAVRWGSLERGDVGDGRFVEDVFIRYKPQIVIHLAGYIEVGESVARPERYLSNNAAKSRVLIGAALRHKVKAFVFSSTCAVYGLPQSDLLAESHRVAPINPYAASKASVERALDAAAWRACAPRRCAISTPPVRTPRRRSARLTIRKPISCLSRSTRHWVCARPLSCTDRIIRRTTARACATTSMSRIWPTPICARCNGWSGRRSGAAGTTCSTSAPAPGTVSGKSWTRSAGFVGRPVPHVYGARRPGDSPRLVGCIDKAQRELDWSPLRGLETQIEDTVRWRMSMRR